MRTGRFALLDLYSRYLKKKQELTVHVLFGLTLIRLIRLEDSNWRIAFELLDDTNMQFLWQALTNRSGGGRDEHWYPESLRLLKPNFRKIKAELIPAIRQVGKKGVPRKIIVRRAN